MNIGSSWVKVWWYWVWEVVDCIDLSCSGYLWWFGWWFEGIFRLWWRCCIVVGWCEVGVGDSMRVYRSMFYGFWDNCDFGWWFKKVSIKFIFFNFFEVKGDWVCMWSILVDVIYLMWGEIDLFFLLIGKFVFVEEL